MTSEFQSAALDRLQESATNPRRVHDDRGLEELANSIRQVGVLEPLLVRECPRRNGVEACGHEKLEIIAGARRFRAAKAAGIEAVPVRVLNLTDDEVLEVQIIENLQRQDVHVLDEARGYAELRKRPNYDVAAIAAKVGKSRGYVYQRLQLLELVPAAEKLLAEDVITAAHALLLARLQKAQQKEVLNWLVRGEGKVRFAEPVAQLRSEIESRYHLDLAGAPWKTDDASLLPAAGACTACPKRTGANADLFGDIQKDDVCTDLACFAKKREAFLKRRVDELEAKGEQVVRVFDHAWDFKERSKLEKTGAVHVQNVRPAGKEKCKSTAKALHVAGPKAGHTEMVCTAKTCKVHGPRVSDSGYRESPADKARREKEKLEREVKQLTRERAALEVITSVKALSGEDLLFVAAALVSEMGGFGLGDSKETKALAELCGITAPHGQLTFTKQQAARSLVFLAIENELHGYSGAPNLEAFAHRYGVDLEVIETAVAAELALSAASKGKPKATRKSAKSTKDDA